VSRANNGGRNHRQLDAKGRTAHWRGSSGDRDADLASFASIAALPRAIVRVKRRPRKGQDAGETGILIVNLLRI